MVSCSLGYFFIFLIVRFGWLLDFWLVSFGREVCEVVFIVYIVVFGEEVEGCGVWGFGFRGVGDIEGF